MTKADRPDEAAFSTNDRALYAAQLERVLASSYFSNSKRYPALLRHIVMETLDGRTGDLKERTLGYTVFARAQDYDTYSDPVVRVTAGEVRRRLAQYYLEPEHEGEPRIELPSGSYVPEFHLALQSVEPAPETVGESLPAAPVVHPHRRWRLAFAAGFGSALLLCFLALGLFLWRYTHRPEERFWRPFANPRSPILVCVGQPNAYMRSVILGDAQQHVGQLGMHMLTQDNLVMGDAVAAANIIATLSRHQLPYQLMGADDANFADVRRGPLVLVSGSDNPWTMRLAGQLRYRFATTQKSVVSIINAHGAPHPEWSVDFSAPYTSLTQDYAIVAHFQDPTTGQMVVLVAGLGVNGTLSASELVSNPLLLREIFSQLPSGAADRNFELVIGTQVVDGHSGPPKLLASEIW